MNSNQWQCLGKATALIPEQFEALERGSERADTTLGINGRYVRRSQLAEVVDPEVNPLRSQASMG